MPHSHLQSLSVKTVGLSVSFCVITFQNMFSKIAFSFQEDDFCYKMSLNMCRSVSHDNRTLI